MLLKDVFDQLSYGELSQLSIGGLGSGMINESNYAQVLSHVTLGLTALYKRFNLKERTVRILLSEDQTVYKINSKYAVSNTGSIVPFKYVYDSVGDPFTDDVLKIEKVVTEQDYELELNDSSDMYSVFTTSTTALKIPLVLANKGPDLPEELFTEYLDLTYRANHPKIDPEGLDPATEEVELPDSYLTALLYFIASRVNNPIGMSGEFNAGNNYAAKYEAECQQLEFDNLEVDRGSQNTRAMRNGWL